MGCVISISDISELRRLKDQLSETHQQLRDSISSEYWNQDTPLKLLIVDDNEVDRMMLSECLGQVDKGKQLYQITSVPGFDEASEELNKTLYDVCLLDFRLGRHSGFELVKKLRALSHAPAFIIITGQIETGMNQEAVELGVYDMIDKKDITPALLERSIRYSQRHRVSELYLSSLV